MARNVFNNRENRERLRYFSWFVFWVLLNSALFLVSSTLLPKIFENQHFFQVTLISFLIYGLFFSVFSRVIYYSIKNEKIYMGSDVFFFYTFAYAFALWLALFLRGYFITDLSVSFLTNYWWGILFVGLVVDVVIITIKRIEFGRIGVKNPFGRSPSQIFTGVTLFVMGVLCWRFSTLVFIDWLNWYEGVGWSFLIGIALMIAGFLVLLAWWRNNVLQHRIGIKWGHW